MEKATEFKYKTTFVGGRSVLDCLLWRETILIPWNSLGDVPDLTANPSLADEELDLRRHEP